VSGLHFHPLTVRSVSAAADDAVAVTFDVPAPLRETFRFQAGQYLTLRCAALGPDVRRSYSICAAPGEALRVGVRHVIGGVFSTWLQRELKVGDTLEALPPQGHFGASLQARPHHVLAVAAGSGITPILSLLKSTLAADGQAHCTLLYGNRNVASAMFKDELDDLKNRYLTRLALHAVYSREVVDSPVNSGRLHADKLVTFLRLAGAVDQAYVCGPHAMNDELEAALMAAGVAPGNIHIERFGIPPADAGIDRHTPRPGDAAVARVAIVRDGVSREVAYTADDANLLAAAARAGMDLPFSCKSGVCATCRARVLQGQVRMDRNFALEPADLQAGFVLTCQSHPLTDRVVLSFDDR
jgi:ring-1,2-phenylacetyl-CoA epoxidase subunit PaaE